MAMIACHECKKEVSSQAKTCPHCGAAVQSGSRIGWAVGIGIVMFIFMMGMVISNSSSSPEAPKSSPSPISITAEELHKHYEINEIAADKKYKGKLLEVTGTIRNIGKALGDPYVNLATGPFTHQIMVNFPDKVYDDKLATYTMGTKIIVTGTCKGKTLGMIMIDMR